MTRAAVAGCAPALLGALDFGFLVVAAPGLGLGGSYVWLFSAGSLAYGTVVLPSEALLGRVGPSRVLAGALAVAASGSIVFAVAGDVATAIAGRVLFGAGTGAAAAPALVLLASDGAFERMGGAIALGFSAGVLLGAWGAGRTGLAVVVAVIAACGAAAPRVATAARTAPGALRLGAATAMAGLVFVTARAAPVAAVIVLGAAVAVAVAGWRAARERLAAPRGGLLVACAAGAATTMSGVGAMVLLGGELAGTSGELVLALFGVATLAAVGAARRLDRRLGAAGTAAAGLAAQAGALLALAAGGVLVPAVVLFGAGHAVANSGAAAAAMRNGTPGAGIFATAQYLAAGAGPLVVAGSAGMLLAAAIALCGAGLIGAVPRPSPRAARRT